MEILTKLGLDEFWNQPLDPASMLEISAWTLDNDTPLEVTHLPKAFLKRLWLLCPNARSTCCQSSQNRNSTEDSPDGLEESGRAVNPLDLVSAVYMSADAFLQQEITSRMVQCHFAVPLLLPNKDPEEASKFLLWPLRSIRSRWTSTLPGGHRLLHEGDISSTSVALVSCIKLGHCGVSKSQVLNYILRSTSDTFLHKGVSGGEQPRRVSNGLVEIAWYLPDGDAATDVFPAPIIFSNLRGDAGAHERNLSLLCKASSAVVVFCGSLKEKEKHLLLSCKNLARKLIVVNLLDSEKNESRVVGFANQNFEEDVGFLREEVIKGGDLTNEELANIVSNTLKNLMPDKLELVTLEAAAEKVEESGLQLDEGEKCKRAMATAELVLNGLDEGAAQFKEKQLPLQGPLWSRVAQLEKEERKLVRQGKEADLQLQNEKKGILKELSAYKMTQAMKIFTDALYTTDKVERTYFLSWMKLKLHSVQSANQKRLPSQFADRQGDLRSDLLAEPYGLQNGINHDRDDCDSFCTDSTFENQSIAELTDNDGKDLNQMPETQSQQENSFHSTNEPALQQQLYLISSEKEIQSEKTESGAYFDDETVHLSQDERMSLQETQQNGQTIILSELHLAPAEEQLALDSSLQHQQSSCSPTPEQEPFQLSLEHFLRETGLIFELTHVSPSSGSQNVLRLPSLASELLLYGVPLELMDGDASNIPIQWLACVLAELKRSLPQEDCRIHVLANLGVHHAKNAEILSAIFGVKFPQGRSTKGVYMLVLRLPDNLRTDTGCDFLFLIDVEGLGSGRENEAPIHDSEIATVAVGLSDILLHNISPKADAESETNLAVVINAVLCNKELGRMPVCQLLAQDEGLKSVLQASELKRVFEMLQTENAGEANSQADDHSVKDTSGIALLKGPWQDVSPCEPANMQYGEAVLSLKRSLFEALKKCTETPKTTNLSDFMSHLCAIWEAVRAQSFIVGLKDTDTALEFSLLCTEISQWEQVFSEHMETWLIEETKKVFITKMKTVDTVSQNSLLSWLKGKAREEVKTEVDKLRLKLDNCLMKDDQLKIHTFRDALMSKMDKLEKQANYSIAQRLEEQNESHCSSTQLKIFEAALEEEQKTKLNEIMERSNKALLQDSHLEEEFEGVWRQILSNFDFRASETDSITTRVKDILKENLSSRGLHKHMKKLEDIGQNQTPNFYIYDEHFGYRSRLKHMFEDNNRPQKLEAQQVASEIIEKYHQFVADKSKSPADFSDSYITELLTNIEIVLKEKSMEIRSAFEVDLKVYLCNAACQDFQKLHDRYAKDREVLEGISSAKATHLAKFIYQFRKRDQCKRMAEAFASMVIRPTVMDFVNRPLGKYITEEIQRKAPSYRSRHTFNQSLLEELIINNRFEDFLEYLNSCGSYMSRKIQNTVKAYLSEPNQLNEWRQQRLGEIVGMVAAAVSDSAEGTNGVLSDAKPLLERVCLTLEKYGNVDVNRAPLEGPLFSFTVDWNYFVRCLMELLAIMRLELAQEFAKCVDIVQSFPSLPIQAQDCLFKKVTGCEEQCPICKAPCDLVGYGHKVHMALHHRPKGILPNRSLTAVSSPLSIAKNSSDQSEDIDGSSIAFQNLSNSTHPDWHFSTDDPENHTTSVYWRYCTISELLGKCKSSLTIRYLDLLSIKLTSYFHCKVSCYCVGKT